MNSQPANRPVTLHHEFADLRVGRSINLSVSRAAVARGKSCKRPGSRDVLCDGSKVLDRG